MKVTPTIYLIAGANGVGKTTFAREFLPKEVNCLRFMNADEVARGLSPFAPEAASIRAGRVLIGEIRAALRSLDSFGWESTLSGRSHAPIMARARERGYEIELHYLSVTSPRVCVERVAQRVREGGHDVPVADIRRRFYRSLQNLVKLYLPLADRWTVWDATATKPRPLLDFSRATEADVRSMLLAVNRALVFPPPMPTKDLPEHVRRAMRAFERVHKMLEAKAAAERVKRKRPGQ